VRAAARVGFPVGHHGGGDAAQGGLVTCWWRRPRAGSPGDRGPIILAFDQGAGLMKRARWLPTRRCGNPRGSVGATAQRPWFAARPDMDPGNPLLSAFCALLSPSVPSPVALGD
jgi:hypothetical protein